MAQSTKDLNDLEFGNQVAHGVTLVDFWAPWCGPCRMQTPIVEEVAAELAGQVTVAKVNVDFNPQVTRHFGIRGIPTLIVFKEGKPVRQLVGLQGKEAVLAALRAVLAQAG